MSVARRDQLSIGIFIALGLLACAGAQAQSATTLAIQGASVVDVTDGSLRPDRTVLVEGSRIAAIGPADDVRVPEGAEVVEAADRYLIPGLWDMHVHAARAERAPRFWPLLIAHGVTGIREMGGDTESLLHWRNESRRPASLAPRIYWSSPMLDGEPPANFHAIAVPDPDTARAVVGSIQQHDFDFLKVYSGLSREAYFAVAEEAGREGMSFAGHVPLSVTVSEASAAGQRSLEHVTELLTACIPQARELSAAHAKAVARDGEASESARAAVEQLMGALAFSEPDASVCAPQLERMVANETWFTPTLTVFQGESLPSSFDGDPRLRWVPPAIVELWHEHRRLTPEQEAQVGAKIMQNALRTVGLVHGSGAGVLAGSDASDVPYIFAGSGLHDELALLVEAGLTPLESLQAATLEPARFLGRSDDIGAVEEGKLADLVLLEANPLEDIRNTQLIHSVVLNGQLLDRARLDAMIAEVEHIAQNVQE